MSLNSIVVMGRITKDIEVRYTPSGTPVANFTVAVDRDYEKDKADFLDCVAWRNTAEFAAKHFHKGSKAVVIGSLQLRDWTDKEGTKRRSAEIVVGSMYFADSKKETGFSALVAPEMNEIEEDEDWPF